MPAVKIYFFTKKVFFLLPDAVSFAAENHLSFHKNFFALLLLPLKQAVKYLLAVDYYDPDFNQMLNQKLRRKTCGVCFRIVYSFV